MGEQIKKLQRFRPAVGRQWLFLISGLLWSSAGIMLMKLALGWLLPIPGLLPVLLGAAGLLVSLLIYRFGFLRIARRNIVRIRAYPRRVCVFAFQEWKSYLIVVVMMTMGIILRGSAFPKPWLALMYTAIGGGLLFSSLHYYRNWYTNAQV